MTDAIQANQVAADQTSRLLQGVSFQIRKCLRAPDADAVHDLRVAIRRFSQLLTVFKPWFASRWVRSIRRQLKSVLSAAGDVRDCDIALKVLSKSRSGGVADTLQTRRKAAARRLAGALQRWVAQKRAAKWRSELAILKTPEEFEGHSWNDLARGVLPGVAEAFFSSGDRAMGKKASGRGLHKFRIETKELRYSLELFQDAYGPGAKVRIEQLRAVQTILGNANDLRTTRRLLAELGSGGKLASGLRKKEKGQTREFRRLWDADFSQETAKQWLRFLGQAPRKPAARSTATVSSDRAAVPA